MFVQADAVAQCRIGDAAYVLPLSGPRRFVPVVLEGPALVAWDRLGTLCSEEEVAVSLILGFDVDRMTALETASDFVMRLLEIQLIHQIHEPH